MVSDVTNNPRIVQACRQFHVKELHVFGSALSKPLSDIHDIDLLVEFERDGYSGAFDQFMGFKNSIEDILGLPVDLITQKQFRNHLFQEEVNRSRKTVYAV